MFIFPCERRLTSEISDGHADPVQRVRQTGFDLHTFENERNVSRRACENVATAKCLLLEITHSLVDVQLTDCVIAREPKLNDRENSLTNGMIR